MRPPVSLMYLQYASTPRLQNQLQLRPDRLHGKISSILPRIVYLKFGLSALHVNDALVLAPITPSAKPPLILERIRYSTAVSPPRLAFTVLSSSQNFI